MAEGVVATKEEILEGMILEVAVWEEKVSEVVFLEEISEVVVWEEKVSEVVFLEEISEVVSVWEEKISEGMDL